MSACYLKSVHKPLIESSLSESCVCGNLIFTELCLRPKKSSVIILVFHFVAVFLSLLFLFCFRGGFFGSKDNLKWSFLAPYCLVSSKMFRKL